MHTWLSENGLSLVVDLALVDVEFVGDLAVGAGQAAGGGHR